MNVHVKEHIRKARVKATAEVFTPSALVNEMLDKLPKEVWTLDKTFCDPACGNGNLLVEVLERKIKKSKDQHRGLKALQSIFWVDIMRDNIAETRMRLLKIVQQYEEITEDHIVAVFKNIIWLNTKRYPNGSLDYDFSFSSEKPKKEDIARWLSEVNQPAEINPGASCDDLEASEELNVEEESGVKEGEIDWDAF